MLNTKENIVMIGMPAVGKSTVGEVLAHKLRYDYLDSDDVIESREQKTLAQIIETHGLDGFLNAEEQHVSSIECRKHVIATGGSVVYSQKIMDHFRKNSVIIYLYVDLDILLTRLTDMKSRGVAVGPGKSIKDLYDERTPLYEFYSDIKIDCGRLTPEQVVEKIMSA